jgi:hypothetical protein
LVSKRAVDVKAARLFIAAAVPGLLALAACDDSTDPQQAVPPPAPAPTATAAEEPTVEEPERVVVPDVVGVNLPNARRTLREVGLRVESTRKSSPEPAGRVLRQRPLGGLEVQPGRTVTLIVAKPKPPPPPPSNCHPSYTGACLDPSASDYDCAGGSGDGPKYTGTVTVVGPDVFGLDGDGDGVGCE